MFPSGLDFPRLHLWSLSLRVEGEGNPFAEGEFWAKLQQLTRPNAVLKDGMKGEQWWGCAGACWAVSLGTGMGKQPRQRGCPLCWAAALPCLRSYWPSRPLCCWMNGKAPMGINSGPKFWVLWGCPEPAAKFSGALWNVQFSYCHFFIFWHFKDRIRNLGEIGRNNW